MPPFAWQQWVGCKVLAVERVVVTGVMALVVVTVVVVVVAGGGGGGGT